MEMGGRMALARYVVDAVVLEGRGVREVARSHGVSKTWVSVQLARYREGGYEALGPRSRRAHTRPNRTSGGCRGRDRPAPQRPRGRRASTPAPGPSTGTSPSCRADVPVGLDHLAGPLPPGVRRARAGEAPGIFAHPLRGRAAQ